MTDTTQRYPRQMLSPIEYREWGDPQVMRAVLSAPPPAEACTDIGADAPPRPLTVSPLRRLLRALRIRIITRGPL